MILLPGIMVYSLLAVLLLVCSMLFLLLFWEKQLFRSIATLFRKKEKQLDEDTRHAFAASEELLQHATQNALNIPTQVHHLDQTAERIMEQQLKDILKKNEARFSHNLEMLHADIEAKLTRAYEHVEQHLREYKAKREKDIETEISVLIQQVVKDTLGKTLSTKEHETLILEALEHAKKEGVLR